MGKTRKRPALTPSGVSRALREVLVRQHADYVSPRPLTQSEIVTPEAHDRGRDFRGTCVVGIYEDIVFLGHDD